MRQPYELFTGLRYTRAKRRNHFISFISVASMLGIAIGVTALITVMSVMNGYEQEMRTRILGMAAHATVRSLDPQGMQDWAAVATLALKNPEVEGVAPYVSGEGMVKAGDALSGAEIRGVDPAQEPKVSDIDQHMVEGTFNSLTPGDYHIVLGAELAENLGVSVNDKIDLMIPQGNVTPAGILPRFRRFTVTGVFKVGMYEFDRGLVLVNIKDAATLYRLDNGVTGVRLRVRDLFQAPMVAHTLQHQLPESDIATDWTREHANLFEAVGTEKTVMFIILSIIILVAVFNIVSTLVMVVQDKQSDVAILRTLGATPHSIMGVFMVQGSIIGFVGTALGVIGGVALATHVETLVPMLEVLTHHQFLNPEIYYISELPSKLEARDVIRVSVLALFLGFFSTLYPAWRASKVQPAEALRYE